MPGGILALPAPRRLDFDGEDAEVPVVSQETILNWDGFPEPSRKRTKREDAINAADEDGGEYSDEIRTKEQMEILSYEPDVGEVVVVNALAGCGKTSTTALLCNKKHAENPSATILYLVYNRSLGRQLWRASPSA